MNFFMLNLADIWVALAVWGCIGITLLCVIYGAVNWNHKEDGGK